MIGMTVKGIHSAGFLEQIDRNKERNSQSMGEYNFEEAMSGQIAGQEPAQESREVVEEDNELAGVASYQSMISARAYYAVDKVSNGAASECEVRGISYEDADYAKICTEKGVVYKAQVSIEDNQVYVEQKKDDGTVTGYLVDMNKVSGEGASAENASAVEQFALEAWEQEKSKEKPDTDTAFAQALEKFYAYAEERVKNGPPKFAIGAAELTIDEWDKLIKSVDKDIDTAKKEMRDRIEKEQEKAEKEAVEALIAERKAQMKGSYAHVFGNSPIMEYNGAVFHYDEEGALCLGDTSNKDDIITVYLEDGGMLKVNRDNLEDLAHAISMFLPEDINRILRAIAEDVKCQEKLKEIESTEFQTAEKLRE